MTLIVHPSVLPFADHRNKDVQLALANAGTDAQWLFDKPALLVVTDAADNILLSIVGYTNWGAGASQLGPDYQPRQSRIHYGNGSANAGTVSSVESVLSRQLEPFLPRLIFYPFSGYTETIRNSGQAAKAFLIVDTRSQYSKEDVSAWPVAHWDGSAALDVSTLPAELPYLQVSVGDAASDSTVRLTSIDLDKASSLVQMADARADIYFANLYRDWTGAKAELEALLDTIPGIGVSLEDIQAREATAYS